MDGLAVRLATAADAASVLRIYAPYVTDTCITFEYQPPAVETIARQIESIQPGYPYLVAELAGHVVAYAYASRYHERAAYRFNALTSIYMDAAYHGRGFGCRLYRILLEILDRQGYHNIYGTIALPNPKSEGLHYALGFSQEAVIHRTGYKFGQWLDVGHYHLRLRDQEPPRETMPVTAAMVADAVAAAHSNG